ncbi:MAG: M28 family metallopeptidase [Bryobacteraceae bacterium]
MSRTFPRRCRALALSLWLLAIPIFVRAQSVEFVRMPRDVIEKRLKRAPEKNADRQAALKELFEESGGTGERLDLQKVKRSRIPNVICTLAGQTDSVIVVGAHFDKTEKGKGVADNWSGAALLPSLLEGLAQTPRRHTYVFVGFTDEEIGLVGSRHYAKQLRPEERKKVKAMVNVDTLGLETTRVWESRSAPNLVETLAQTAASLKLPLAISNVELVGSTDSESFREQGIPSISIHTVTDETFPILHTSQDNFESIRLDDYYDSYRMILAFLALLDLKLD